MSASGLYVYAIAPAPVPAAGLGSGIDGAAIKVRAWDGLAVVVHEHPAAPYDGPDADAKRWVVQHSEVVERVWQHAGTVLPMTFNMIVQGREHESAEARLRDWVRDGVGPFSARLEALRGRAELRVNIRLNQRVVGADNQELAQLRDELSQRPAGVQRLLRKRLEQREQEIADTMADQMYPECRHRLVECAEDYRENRKLPRTPGAVPVLSASILVHLDSVERVGLELATIQDEEPAAEIEFLGPWPPYSFAEVTETGGSKPA